MLLASALVFYNAPTAGVCAHGHIDGKRNGLMRAARPRRLAPHPRGALSPHTTPEGARPQRRRQGDEEARKWQINVENVALCVGLRRCIFLRHKFSRSGSRSTTPRSLLLANPKARRSPPSRSRSRDRAPDFLAPRARARNERNLTSSCAKKHKFAFERCTCTLESVVMCHGSRDKRAGGDRAPIFDLT